MNQFHNLTLDFFFKYWSSVGNGFIFVFLIAAFLFYRYYYVILTLVIILIQTLVVQVLKMVIFRYLDRPILIFRNIPGIHYVEGVSMHLYQTFPSGHSATAFSVATLLALAVKNKKLSLVWYSLAILVAISRVYLLQHFFIDTYSGALIGILVAGVSWYLLKILGALKSEALNRSLTA